MNNMTDEQILRAAGYKQAFTVRDVNADLRPTMRGGKHVLNVHADARGGLVELWRRSWNAGTPNDGDGVAQAYLSITEPNVVKGWHAHAVQTDRFVVVQGRILLATFEIVDDGAHGRIVERVLDASRSERVDVPPLVAHGWIALGTEQAVVLNLVSHEYSGTDEWRRPANEGPTVFKQYEWRRNRDG
jgi:dTDP-4-dehydrorhamnose 3,5-epimerase-like enzyme